MYNIPSSKSHTIRAILIALLAESVSIINNPLKSRDTETAVELCKAMGAKTNWTDNKLVIDSTHLIKGKEVFADCENSGTTLFFATAMLASTKCRINFTGDESLRTRSALPLLNSLKDLNVKIEGNGNLPYTVCGPITGGKTRIDCVSSQYLSALLLACPLAEDDTDIEIGILNELPYVLMTEKYLDLEGIRYEHDKERKHYHIFGKQKYKALNVSIPGDFSSATFLFAAAAVSEKKITINNLDKNDVQGDKRVLNILEEMDCSVTWNNNSVSVQGPEKLKGGIFDLNDIPDALPALSVVGCFADSPVILKNVQQARIKECDRIHAMTVNLNLIGGKVSEFEDGLTIQPVEQFLGGEVDSFKDHRISMAMAIASLKCQNKLSIKDKEVAEITFPSFFGIFKSLTDKLANSNK